MFNIKLNFSKSIGKEKRKELQEAVCFGRLSAYNFKRSTESLKKFFQVKYNSKIYWIYILNDTVVKYREYVDF